MKLRGWSGVGISLWALAFAPGELLVKTRDVVDGAKAMQRRLGALETRALPLSPGWFRVRVSAKADLSALIEKALQDPSVEWAEPNYRLELDPAMVQGGTGDPRAGELWALGKLRVPEVWAQGYVGTSAIKVGVVDTGIDWAHPDLTANLFTNAGEVDGNERDDDRNGYVDDVHGFDFEAKTPESRDDYGHGTHVAGIIGAVGGNGVGIMGINQRVTLMPLRWMKKGSGWSADATEAIRYAVANGARVINASWGGIGYSKAMEEALKEARDRGVLFVASAGNNKSDNDVKPWHPAAYQLENCVAVAALDEQDRLAEFSNWGANTVALAAPGTGILSTYPNNNYTVLQGTSMAAAEVSGVAALIFSVRPDLRAETVKRLLIETSAPLASLAGKVRSQGRVDAYAAVQAALALPHLQAVHDEQDLRGQETPWVRKGGGVRPDRVEAQAGAAGTLELQFVRVDENGAESVVPGVGFSAAVGSQRGRFDG